MLSRRVANITEPERKLEDLERQLKYKLDRAREITSASSLEEPIDKTQEELMNELEVLAKALRISTCLSLTLPSTTAISTGTPISKTKSAAYSSARPLSTKQTSAILSHR